jgi:glycerol-3-phosphate acyltransferase PlsY
MAAGFGAILGHNYPFTVSFKGGQGVSTIMGVFFVLAAQPMLVMLAVMAITLALTRHIFSMTLLSAPLLPLLIWLFGLPTELAYFSLIVIVYVIFRSRHRLKELRVTGTREH